MTDEQRKRLADLRHEANMMCELREATPLQIAHLLVALIDVLIADER